LEDLFFVYWAHITAIFVIYCRNGKFIFYAKYLIILTFEKNWKALFLIFSI